MRRGFAALAIAAAVAVATACVRPGPTSSRAATEPRAAAAISDTAEVVIGPLVAPPSRRFLARVRNGKMGGVVLLGNGWLTRSTAARVTSQLQQAACTRGEPLLVAVDQEGGIVRRLPWAPPTEAPADMSGTADAQTQADDTATALRSVGIDVDFAPVVDTPSSAGSFLGTRAFSRSRSWNASMARAFVDGRQTNGIAATAKHFPGLGLAGGNTDRGRDRDRLGGLEAPARSLPFQSAIRAGVQLVMLSTAIYPRLDASKKPAAFSRRIVYGLLRKSLGFQGVTVTDSLTAPAATAIPHTATRAMLAGSDLLVFGAESASERLFDAGRGRGGLGAPAGAARTGRRADPGTQGVARRRRRPDLPAQVTVCYEEGQVR